MRLFVAVEVGEPARALAERVLGELRQRRPALRWVSAENLHLTLVFLGEQPQERLPVLTAILDACAAGVGPMTLELGGGGTFGAPSRPRVLWMDVRGEIAKLAWVQAALVGALRPLGVEVEDRAFLPHLTLARAKHPRGDAALADLPALVPADSGSFTVGEVLLMQSQGGRYLSLHRAALSGAPS